MANSGANCARAFARESALIKDAGYMSAVSVLVERVCRLILLARIPDATAETAPAASADTFKSIAAHKRQSLTYDHGRDMACHRELARAAVRCASPNL